MLLSQATPYPQCLNATINISTILVKSQHADMMNYMFNFSVTTHSPELTWESLYLRFSPFRVILCLLSWLQGK